MKAKYVLVPAAFVQVAYGYLMTCYGVWQHVWGEANEQGKRVV